MKALICLLAALMTVPLLAAEPTTINIRKSDLTSVNLAPLGGSSGGKATQVLKNDLVVSGLFDFAEQGRARFSISGTAASDRLQGVVTDARGATVLQKTYSAPLRTAVHQFADDIVSTLTGEKGIASTKIAFVSTRTGRKEIYTADYDGANVQQLTRDNSISVAPALSPDGRRLAYTGYKSGYADIYLIDLNSGSRKTLVKYPGTNSGASFSPDGGRIACTVSKDGNPELYVVSVRGGGRRVTKTRGVESSPTWAPDGRLLGFASDQSGGPQLYQIPAGGGKARKIPTGYSYCTDPSWSPDGSKIAFTARTGGFSIAVKDLTGGSTRVVASGGEAPVWGPNSRHLIYSSGTKLILLDTKTGKSFPIVSGLGKVTEPTWSR